MPTEDKKNDSVKVKSDNKRVILPKVDINKVKKFNEGVDSKIKQKNDN